MSIQPLAGLALPRPCHAPHRRHQRLRLDAIYLLCTFLDFH